MLKGITEIASIIPAKQRGIKVKDVASAMLLEFESRTEKEIGINYFTSDDMREIIISNN